MIRKQSSRRVSALAISRGSSRRLMGGSSNGDHSLRRCQTTTTATVVKTDHNAPPSNADERAGAIRGWVVGFLGRTLRMDEEELLLEDCKTFVTANESDQDAARRVVQTLMSSYFLEFDERNGGDENDASKTTTSSIHLEAEAGLVETMAAVIIQARARRYVVRKRVGAQLALEKAKEQLPQLNNTTVKIEDTTDRIEDKDKRQSLAEEARESLGLSGITETVTFYTDTKVQEVSRDEDNDDAPMTDDSTKDESSRGHAILDDTNDELSVMTEVVKITIVIRVQALVRSFLVRRRRRRLRKARSIRALRSRPSLMVTTKGTPVEHGAATAIQRTVRGYVQQWKYWTAMRQQQLDEIKNLRAKQLRKIQERKKTLLKTTKKELFFDATSLARQLQRAKRAIKFLVKEEKRSLKSNQRLEAEFVELKKANQWLDNSTSTATVSVETLQAEIKGLSQRNEVLETRKKDYVETVKSLTEKFSQVSTDAQVEKQRKEEIQACIAKIKERAASFFQEHPQLEEAILVAAAIKPSCSAGENGQDPSQQLDCSMKSSSTKPHQSPVTS